MTSSYQRRHRGRIQAVLLEWAGTTMDQADAHYVVDGIAEVMPCLDDIEARIVLGERS